MPNPQFDQSSLIAYCRIFLTPPLFLVKSWPFLASSLSTGERSAGLRLQPGLLPHVRQQAESQLCHGGTHRPVRGLTSRYGRVCVSVCACFCQREREIMDGSRRPRSNREVKGQHSGYFQAPPTQLQLHAGIVSLGLQSSVLSGQIQHLSACTHTHIYIIKLCSELGPM